ncbi:hypothetical protein [Spirillospora sp. NPDC047279]|uniref:hypothetical protein n=1 Tax=Spirillospora sp. NPDC047279 TaxID=3155478 RepID=UPI0033EAA250
MDELEHKVAEHLLAAATDPGTHPSAGLGEAVLAGTAARRRRRRTLVTAVAAGVAATMAVPVAVFAASGRDGARPPDPAKPVTSVTPSAVQTRGALIPRSLPGGRTFRAMALGPDGSVLGMPVAVNGEGVQLPQRGVWLAGPEAGPPRRVADTPASALPYLWTMAVGATSRVWPEGETLRCQSPGRTDVRTLRASWSGREPFYVDGGLIVWGDAERRTIVTAAGCDALPHSRSLPGPLVAVSDQNAYARTRPDRVEQVNLRHGGRRPLVAETSDEAVFGAGPGTLAWADRGRLTVQRLTGSGQQSVVARRLPFAGRPGYTGTVTVGLNVVVYSAVHQDTGDGGALVVDLRTGAQVTFPGAAWAAGDLLLRDLGDGYLLERR